MEMEHPVPALLPDNKAEVLGAPLEVQREAMGNWSSMPPAEAPPVIGPGLQNLGNTCFLNAVLQCVTHTVPLVQGIRASTHRSPCLDGRGGVIGGERRFCSLCSLRQHLQACFSAMGGIVVPHGFANNLNNISSSLNRYQQEDAHEFLNCLLDSLHTSCLDPQFRDGPSSLQEDSFIKQIFGGRLRSQVKCCNCGHISNTYEPLLDLSLEIEDAESLEEALESFTKVEKIEDPEIRITCDGCNAQVSVLKQFTLDQVPTVVALHLKRFKSNGYFANKIDNFVKYPRSLDLKPFLSAPDDVDSLKYELYAVLVHEGRSSFFGHYYCFIRSSPDAWYMMDDETVIRRNEQQALEQRAYILFYMKQGTPWFSSLLEGRRTTVDVNIMKEDSPLSVLGYVANSQNSSPDSEDNLKSMMATLDGDEGLTLFDGTSLDDAHMSQVGSMNCTNLMIIPWGDEELSTSADTFLDTEMNDSGRNQVSCSPETSKNDVLMDVGNNSDNAIDGQSKIPCRRSPNSLSTNKFYNETWDDDEEDNLSEMHLDGKEGKCANEADDTEAAALASHLKTMSSNSRRNLFEQCLLPIQKSGNAERRRRKRKQHLDCQEVPGHASPMPSMRQAPCKPLHCSGLHEILAGDDSQVELAVDSNHSDKRKTD